MADDEIKFQVWSPTRWSANRNRFAEFSTLARAALQGPTSPATPDLEDSRGALLPEHPVCTRTRVLCVLRAAKRARVCVRVN
jgi:hypothetical protein